jgi:hypothetical protein
MSDGAPRQWYEMIRAEAGGEATIRIFGDIGESWWGDSVSAAQFAKDLDEIGPVGTLNLRVNSPGGDMFDGVAIFNTLRNHEARKVIHVDGLAASAASVIAMAGDEVVMGTGTQLMIHNAWSFMVGDAAHAPTPRTPARAGGSHAKEGFVEIKDEDFATLRTKLGLEDGAEIGDVLDALDDQGESTAGAAEQQEPVAAKLPAGVLAVDKGAWEQVQADAALGRKAREDQVRARRAAKVDEAIVAGKVLPSRRAHWIEQIEKDEEGISAALDGLTAIFGTAEIGHDDGTVADDNTLEGVRGSAAYQSWKVI